MAEGDTFTDPATGEKFVEARDGSHVLQAKTDPLVGRIEAFAGGAQSGAMDNLLMGKGILDAFAAPLDLVGLDTAAESLRDAGQGIRDIRDRIQPESLKAQQAQFPGTFLGGEVTGSFLPGSPAAQGALGFLQGVGLGETPGAQILGGSLGVFGGVAGGRGGARLARAKARRTLQEGTQAQQARASALNTLEEMGIPLRESDELVPGTAGQAGASQRDRLRQLLDPGDATRVKRDALNEVVTDTILPGSASDGVTNNWMTRLFDEVDTNFEGVRSMLPAVTAQTDLADTAAIRMLENLNDVRPDQLGRVSNRAEAVISAYEGGTLTPERWSQLRSTIAADARSAHRIGEWETAESLYGVRQSLDDIVTGGDPEVVAALADANELWRYREVMDSANVINKELDVNPGAFLRNIQKMFPQVWRTGTRNPEKAQLLNTVVSAAEQFPEFRSSGTGEMLTAGSILKKAQANAMLAVGSLPQAAGGTAGRGVSEIITDALSTIPDAFNTGLDAVFGE